MNASWLQLLGSWVTAITIAAGFALAASAWTRANIVARGQVARAERITDWLVAYVVLAITVAQALGFARQFRLVPVLLAAALLAAVGVIGGGWPELRALALELHAAGRRFVRSPPLLGAGVIGVALWVRAVAVREVSWDGLLYHLTYPAVWIRHGGFVPFDAPGVWEQYESFPKGAEALYALAMLPLSADDLTYFVHVPLWLGTGCALYATARRVGCERRTAELAAACALASPALGAYLGPANIEVPVVFAIAAAACAATRAIVASEPSALLACWLALGLGASLKVTSLAYLPFGVIVMLACMRTAPVRACLKHTALGALLGAVVAGPWYANNLVRCDNPLYPAALPGATSGPAAGTLANAWIIRESSVLAQRVVLDVLHSLATLPWKIMYQGPGWLYLFTMIASINVVAVRKRHPRATFFAAVSFTALAWVLTLLYLVMPWNGVFWAANARFLTPALLFGLLSLAASTSLAPRLLSIPVWCVAVAVVLMSWIQPRYWRPVRATAVIDVVRTLAHEPAHMVATTARNQLPADAPLARLWQHIDTLPPSRIGYAVGGVDAQEGWLFYPLFGRGLQHDVRYLDIERSVTAACRRRGLIRGEPDERAWLERVRSEAVDRIAISGRPQELRWVEAHPELFTPEFRSDEHRVFARARK